MSQSDPIKSSFNRMSEGITAGIPWLNVVTFSVNKLSRSNNRLTLLPDMVPSFILGYFAISSGILRIYGSLKRVYWGGI